MKSAEMFMIKESHIEIQMIKDSEKNLIKISFKRDAL